MTSAPGTARSWWGWGNTAEEATGAEVKSLVDRSAALLPNHDFTDHPPPEASSLEVAPSRVVAPASLAALCSDQPIDRIAHARGKAFRDVVRNLLGRIEHVPDLVARPRAEQDVVDLLDWCTRDGIPVIPYGGGSSVVGGVEPRFEGPAVTIDMQHLATVLELEIGPAARPASRPAPTGHTWRTSCAPTV